MFQHKVQLSDSESLILRWAADWSHLTIKFNTTDVEKITDKAVLEAGKWFSLPSGQYLFVRLVKNELELWDGSDELISGLKSGQSDHFGMAWKMLLAFGVIFSLLGIGLFPDATDKTKAWQLEFDIGMGLGTLGLGYISLALWARKKKEKMPLKIAIAAQTVLLLCMAIGGILPTVINGILFYSLYKGLNSEPLKSTKFQPLDDTGLLDDDL